MDEEQKIEEVIQAIDGGPLDEEGYPKDSTLEIIRTWQSDWHRLMSYVHRAWRYPDRFIDEGIVERDEKDFDRGVERQYYLSTGGWSGNESIISAMKENYVFWMMCWYQSNRGGHYLFRLKEKKEEEKK